MPQDASAESEIRPKSARPNVHAKDASRQWFSTPQPIKRLFDKFPLQTYSPNELPLRTAAYRNQNALYIFTTEDGAKDGLPSFNPSCLKSQAYLKFQGVDFVTIPSSNHASPTGALPFLLPSTSSPNPSTETNQPVISNRIQRWASEKITRKSIYRADFDSNSVHMQDRREPEHEARGAAKGRRSREHPSDMRYEAYMSLLDSRIRHAYVRYPTLTSPALSPNPLTQFYYQLYSLYLTSSNFDSIVIPYYINPSTSNSLVRLTLSHQLRCAAETELLKQSPMIDVEAIYRDCDKAFEALAELLGKDEYFFGEEKPGLFDASVFAYTNVLLDNRLDWRDGRIGKGLRYGRLLEHRTRIMEGWFGHRR
ncbi:hypothetical protein MMC28_006625 [Mycoblastus sanguinarius]|nr:hypothetical protein [Mycoblastus sanguinarius]